MTANTEQAPGKGKNIWRIIGWGGAVALILTPLVAMQFTSEVDWDETDFIFATIIFGGIGLLLEGAMRLSSNAWYRAGAIFALLAIFVVIWANGAVGMIGNEDNPVNLWFGGVLAIAVMGAILARFRANGMSHTMFAAGTAQATIAVFAGIFGTDMRGGIFTLVLAGLWVISGALFRGATAEQAAA